MKILGVVIQNKKGSNLLIASSTSITTKSCVRYSHLIYEHILESYRTRLKIERTITLDYDLICACSISKQYILYVFSTKNDLPLAFDSIRKITDHFNRAGSTPAARIENIPKKLVQYMSILEEFLYCRQLSTKEFIPMQSQTSSRKKPIQQEIFNKFPHINTQTDKKFILDLQRKSHQKQQQNIKDKCKVIEQAEAFQIKSQDEIYMLDIDHQKQQFINSYRRNIIRLAMGKRRTSQRFLENRGRSNSTILVENREEQQMIDYLDETTLERQKIKLKMMEKMTLHLHKDKVKQVHQLGQLIVEGTQQETAKILLKGPNLWNNAKILSKRLSPNSLESKMLNETEIEFKTVPGYKSKPLVDYVMRTQVFSPDKIPLLFIYSMEVNSNNIEFTFKYKMNQKWKYKIYDFDINVYLNKEFVVLDCRSIPVAHSLKNNKVTWKTKEIHPNSPNSKGKILLAFGQAKFPPKKIISEIKLNMKAPCGILEGLNAECQQEWGYLNSGEKTLIVEYRISPS